MQESHNNSTESIFLRHVFYDGRVWKHFQKRIWLNHEENYIEVLRRIVRDAANLQNHEIPDSEDKLIELLTSSLSGVRYLIVLQESWFDEHADNRNFLVRVLKRTGDEGSKIIVTTSFYGVIFTTTQEEELLDCPISRDDWRRLFEKVAFG